MQALSPLVILTVAAIVTNPLDDHILERLTWLDAALKMLDARVSLGLDGYCNQVLTRQQNPELGDNILARICTVIQTRLQEAYMAVSEKNGVDPILKHIAQLNKRATELKNIAEGLYGSQG